MEFSYAAKSHDIFLVIQTVLKSLSDSEYDKDHNVDFNFII